MAQALGELLHFPPTYDKQVPTMPSKKEKKAEEKRLRREALTFLDTKLSKTDPLTAMAYITLMSKRHAREVP